MYRESKSYKCILINMHRYVKVTSSGIAIMLCLRASPNKDRPAFRGKLMENQSIQTTSSVSMGREIIDQRTFHTHGFHIRKHRYTDNHYEFSFHRAHGSRMQIVSLRRCIVLQETISIRTDTVLKRKLDIRKKGQCPNLVLLKNDH